MKFKALLITFTILFSLLLNNLFAIERAPRISDREIIEGLIEIKESNKHLDEKFTTMLKAQDEKFTIKFNVLDKKIDEIRSFMMWGFGVIFSGMFALVGFILWDRRSTLAPAVAKMEEISVKEKKLTKENNQIRQILYNYAKKSPELANILNQYPDLSLSPKRQSAAGI